MKKSFLRVFFCLLGLLCTIPLAGCGGTETGNPSGEPTGITVGGTIADRVTSCFDQEDATVGDCVLALLLLLSLSGQEGTPQELETAGVLEDEAIRSVHTGDCEDENSCTEEECHQGFCAYQVNPLDEDLDEYVGDACGGLDCDDSNGMIQPGFSEAPYDDEICSDGVDNNCGDLADEEEV